MKDRFSLRNILRSLSHYAVFFLFMAAVITCSMMLFVSTMAETMQITLTEENIETAAKLTFGNVVFLSLICTIIDGIRRKFLVYRPVERITDAAERFMQGDFSVRIRPTKSFSHEDIFNDIINCFNNMAQELSGIETLRTDFIANVSHEIKTPLSVIQNYATMLTASGLEEEKRIEYAKAIHAASRRMADLITNILKLNKLENQKIYPQKETFDLGEQLCECLLGFEDIWEEKGVMIDTDIEDDVLIKGDAEMFSLIWNNLFSNAFKFTNEGGTVSLSLNNDDTYATVKIKDTGVGISKEVGKHMFDKFYQGDTSRASQGNGLGLALVKRVIDITGSDIAVESEVGKGTVFTVRIPKNINENAEEELG